MKKTVATCLFVLLVLPLTMGFQEKPKEQVQQAKEQQKERQQKEQQPKEQQKNEDSSKLSPPDKLPTYEWKWEADQKAYEYGKTLRQTPRGEQAVRDSDKLTRGKIREILSSWLGVQIDLKKTPHLVAYYQMITTAIKAEIRKLKPTSSRPRPYALDPNDPTCRPELRGLIHPRHSYPSGHAATYWMLALGTAALRTDSYPEIMLKAREMGESRWICGHHWASDVEIGREIASIIYAKLSAGSEFQELLIRAQTELSMVRQQRAPIGK